MSSLKNQAQKEGKQSSRGNINHWDSYVCIIFREENPSKKDMKETYVFKHAKPGFKHRIAHCDVSCYNHLVS